MKRSHAVGSLAVAAGITLAMPVFAQAVTPAIDSVAGRAFVQRGDAYVQITGDLALQPTDSLVLFDGASVSLKCGDRALEPIAGAGSYPVPQCTESLAAAPSQPASANPGAAQPATQPTPGDGVVGYGATMNTVALTALAAFTVAVAADDDEKPEQPASP